MRNRLRRLVVLSLLAVLAAGSLEARREKLALRHLTLDLPGPPAKVIPVDVDGDGRRDLVVVVAYTEIEEIGDSRLEGMVEFTTVIPAVFDRREVRVYLARGARYAPALALELPADVLHMEAAAGSAGVIALTDAGLSRLEYDPSGETAVLSLQPVISARPVLAGTRSFYASLELLHDLNGDGVADVLFPATSGLRLYLGGASGPEVGPADELSWPDSQSDRWGTARRYPWPQVRELNGDGVADLLFVDGFAQSRAPEIYLGSHDGTFRAQRSEATDCHDRLHDLRVAVADGERWPWPRELDDLRDLDGDGRAEAIFSAEQARGDGFRKEMKDAKKPIQLFQFHRLDEALAIESAPYFSMEAIGHTGGPEMQDEGFPIRLDQFADLDNDGREDLITITLDFSIFQVLKILTTKRIGIGVDFHVFAQRQDGSFERVPDLDLSEKLKLDLNDLKLGRFAQFAGDFDGDGRQDFVHLGRGTTVTIHRGEPGCRYPSKPDLVIELDEEPESLDLIRIEDIDGDGLSDLRITRPLPDDDPDVTAPVRLDLYLSEGAE